MSQWQAALISKIVSEKSAREAIKRGVVSDTFSDNECESAWNYIVKCITDVNRGGRVPTKRMILDKFPGFEFVKAPEEMSALVHKVMEEKLYSELKELSLEIKEKVQEGDSFDALEHMASRISMLKARNRLTEVIDVAAATKSVLARYDMRAELKGITGIPYPWDHFTADTGGANDGDLICIAGRPGIGKSWLCFDVAVHWHRLLSASGRPPIIFTKEMNVTQVHDRCAAIACGLDYRRFKQGKLSKDERADFKGNLRAWRELGPFYIAQIHSSGEAVLAEMDAFVDEFEPGAMLFDGFYFACQRDHQVTSILTTGTKDRARDKWHIPALVTTQLNQEADKNKNTYSQGRTGGTAYGDSMGQDADVLLKAQRTAEDFALGEVQINPSKVREGTTRPWSNFFKPAANLRFKHMVETEEYDRQSSDDPADRTLDDDE